MKQNQARISVVLPVYNGAACVHEAIESIQDQTYPHWEMIILDDGSSDNSYVICQGLAGGDDRIQVVRNPTNWGLAKSMNRLVALAQGEFVAVQEQDDISIPERFEREVDLLDRRQEVGLVSGIAAWMDEDGQVFAHFPDLLARGGQYPQDRQQMVKYLYVEQCKVVNAACMFRRSAAEQIPGPYDEEARMSIDWQFFIHLAHRWMIMGIPEYLVLMRRGKSHQHLSAMKELQFREARRCIQKIYTLYHADPGSPLNRVSFRKAMATQLILEARYYGRLSGASRLAKAIYYDPANPQTWKTFGELGRRMLGRPKNRPDLY